ncbi:hypothetical protein [Bartonella sp. F02]|nr:hypothetical protein [Bartonella sp. F02]MCZ2327965.1 hypothetical protein [Bartonella sp. F02]
MSDETTSPISGDYGADPSIFSKALTWNLFITINLQIIKIKKSFDY